MSLIMKSRDMEILYRFQPLYGKYFKENVYRDVLDFFQLMLGLISKSLSL